MKQTREEWGFTQNEFSEIMKHIQVLGPAIQKVFIYISIWVWWTNKVQAIQRHLHQNQNTQPPIPPPTEQVKKTSPPLQVPPVEPPLPRTEVKCKPSAVQSKFPNTLYLERLLSIMFRHAPLFCILERHHSEWHPLFLPGNNTTPVIIYSVFK